MSETMLVTQALDERDLLVKKIGDKIEAIKFTDTKKRNEERTASERLSVEEFAKNAQAAYQQIMDLIDRYQRIDAAITASNAKSVIETSYGKYTVANAISLRNRLKDENSFKKKTDFEVQLVIKMNIQFSQNVILADNKNKSLETQAETMRLSILGKDGKIKDEKPLEVVDTYIRENTTDVIDPLDVQNKIKEINEKRDTLIKELDTLIKVSNATTTIEF